MVDEQDKQEMRNDVQALREDLAKLQNDIQGMAQSLMERGRKQAEEARDRMNTQVENGMEALEECIEKRPVTSLLTAFGIGIVVGTIFSRK